MLLDLNREQRNTLRSLLHEYVATIDMIQARHAPLDMMGWGETVRIQRDKQDNMHNCGTSCCVAGWYSVFNTDALLNEYQDENSVADCFDVPFTVHNGHTWVVPDDFIAQHASKWTNKFVRMFPSKKFWTYPETIKNNSDIFELVSSRFGNVARENDMVQARYVDSQNSSVGIPHQLFTVLFGVTRNLGTEEETLARLNRAATMLLWRLDRLDEEEQRQDIPRRQRPDHSQLPCPVAEVA